MRRNGGVFWGIILTGAGCLFLLSNLRIIQVSIWSVLWPLFLIAIGVWVILGVAAGQGSTASELRQMSVPLEGAEKTDIHINYTAGRIHLNGNRGVEPGQAMAGTFAGGIGCTAKRAGAKLDLKMESTTERMSLPWEWGPHSREWVFGLNGDVPVALDINTGASEALLDLSPLRVADLKVETGASSAKLILPARAGYTRAWVKAGAASVKISVPPGTALRVRKKGELSTITVDTAHFPALDESLYQSPDYDTAANKIDLEVEASIGSVDIRRELVSEEARLL
jgi:hypothetical protein